MNTNSDDRELAKFSELAHRWWDPSSEFRPLHEMNPVRLAWIQNHVELKNKKIVDIGCGGGILTESLAQQGAFATGIDLSDKALTVAKLHMLETETTGIDYRKISAEELAATAPGQFDVVTCMEMLEHVPNPTSTIRAAATLVKPGGYVFFSTLNRNVKSYLFAVIGAEYILGLLAKGTHDYKKFIRPSELDAMIRSAGLVSQAISGISYDPFSHSCKLTPDCGINYMAMAIKPLAA